MKILVTGGTGFIGSYLIKTLQEKGYETVCFGRNKPKDNDLPFVQGDIRNKDDILKAVKGVDAVVHLIVSVSSNDFKANNDINVLGAKNLVEACKKNKVRKIIFTSSVVAMLENKDNYGMTKVQAEEVFQRSGLDITILRLATVYGKGGKGYTKMVKNVTAVPFVIPLIGNGKYERQPVYVEDVVETILKVLERDNTVGRTYYLAGETISYREMLTVISKQLGVKKIFLPVPAVLWKGLGLVLENIVKNPPMSKRDITSTMAEAVFDDDSADELGFRKRKFEEGAKKSS